MIDARTLTQREADYLLEFLTSGCPDVKLQELDEFNPLHQEIERVVFALKGIAGGMKYQELGEMMGVTAGTVRVIVRTALNTADANVWKTQHFSGREIAREFFAGLFKRQYQRTKSEWLRLQSEAKTLKWKIKQLQII